MAKRSLEVRFGRLARGYSPWTDPEDEGSIMPGNDVQRRSVTLQKMWIFSSAGVRTPNLAQYLWVLGCCCFYISCCFEFVCVFSSYQVVCTDVSQSVTHPMFCVWTDINLIVFNWRLAGWVCKIYCITFSSCFSVLFRVYITEYPKIIVKHYNRYFIQLIV